MTKRLVDVTMLVEVETDDSKFTEAFMAEFRKSFFPFFDMDDHAEHIAQLEAREMLNPDFTEGYGPLKDMGIEAKVVLRIQEVRGLGEFHGGPGWAAEASS